MQRLKTVLRFLPLKHILGDLYPLLPAKVNQEVIQIRFIREEVFSSDPDCLFRLQLTFQQPDTVLQDLDLHRVADADRQLQPSLPYPVQHFGQSRDQGRELRPGQCP